MLPAVTVVSVVSAVPPLIASSQLCVEEGAAVEQRSLRATLFAASGAVVNAIPPCVTEAPCGMMNDCPLACVEAHCCAFAFVTPQNWSMFVPVDAMPQMLAPVCGVPAASVVHESDMPCPPVVLMGRMSVVRKQRPAAATKAVVAKEQFRFPFPIVQRAVSV